MRQFSVERILNNVRYVPLLLVTVVLLLAPGAWGQNVNRLKLKCGETCKVGPSGDKLPGEYRVVEASIKSTNPLVATGAKTTTADGRKQNDTSAEIEITGIRGAGGRAVITYDVENLETHEVTHIRVPVEVK